MRAIGRFGAAFLCYSVAIAAVIADQGQTPTELPGAVHAWPDDGLGPVPFDVQAFFAEPPQAENAAPLYIEALAKFGGEWWNCLPPGTERERADRIKTEAWTELEQALDSDPASVTAERIEAVIRAYDDGFAKLAEAQKRPRCVFASGIDYLAVLPHLSSCRQVARVAKLRLRRSLERGEIDAAIDDVATVLRLARDLIPRGGFISELVSMSITGVTARDLIPPILQAPGLTTAQADRLLALLHVQDQAYRHAWTEANKAEYLAMRSTLFELVRKQEQLRLRLGSERLPEQGSVVAALVYPTVTSALAPGEAPPAPGATPAPPDYRGLDERMARTSEDELRKAVARLSDFYGALVKLNNQPAIEQLRALPDIKTYAPGSDDLSDAIRGLAPPIESLISSLGRYPATIRSTQGLVALRRWQLTHEGRLPETLSESTRAAGLDPLIDPFDGKPLRMALIDGSAVVYSVGRDRVDDGGRVDSKFDSRPGDLIFTLPNVAHQ